MNFETSKLNITIGTFSLELILVDNIDEIYDDLINKGSEHEDVKDERIPYWAELWASSLAMAEYLVENAVITEGVSVTELGCGLGLPSIIAGKMGANVTLTDYLDDALQFAELNWKNNLPETNAHFKKLDWRTPDPSVSADIVLASDVAYEKRAFEPLLKAFKSLCHHPQGRIIVTEPNRTVSKNFFSNLHTEGYHVKHSIKKIERKGHLFQVNIYDLTFKE